MKVHYQSINQSVHFLYDNQRKRERENDYSNWNLLWPHKTLISTHATHTHPLQVKIGKQKKDTIHLSTYTVVFGGGL